MTGFNTALTLQAGSVDTVASRMRPSGQDVRRPNRDTNSRT
jgi:hypothetical protein